jgi:hypothetical protein
MQTMRQRSWPWDQPIGILSVNNRIEISVQGFLETANCFTARLALGQNIEIDTFCDVPLAFGLVGKATQPQLMAAFATG